MLVQIQVAAVVEKSVVVRLHVLPRPVVGGELTVGAVLLGDVLSRIIVGKTGEMVLGQRRPHLHGVEQGVRRDALPRLVTAHK